MQWTLKFLKWKSSAWLSKTSLSPNPLLSSALHEGLNVCAFQQVAVFTSLHNHFLSLWCGLKILNNSFVQPALICEHLEEVMQGIDGGNVDPE